MAQQTLVVLRMECGTLHSIVSWQDVDDAPEAGPATATRGADVPSNQASGGADGH